MSEQLSPIQNDYGESLSPYVLQNPPSSSLMAASTCLSSSSSSSTSASSSSIFYAPPLTNTNDSTTTKRLFPHENIDDIEDNDEGKYEISTTANDATVADSVRLIVMIQIWLNHQTFEKSRKKQGSKVYFNADEDLNLSLHSSSAGANVLCSASPLSRSPHPKHMKCRLSRALLLYCHLAVQDDEKYDVTLQHYELWLRKKIKHLAATQAKSDIIRAWSYLAGTSLIARLHHSRRLMHWGFERLMECIALNVNFTSVRKNKGDKLSISQSQSHYSTKSFAATTSDDSFSYSASSSSSSSSSFRIPTLQSPHFSVDDKFSVSVDLTKIRPNMIFRSQAHHCATLSALFASLFRSYRSIFRLHQRYQNATTADKISMKWRTYDGIYMLFFLRRLYRRTVYKRKSNAVVSKVITNRMRKSMNAMKNVFMGVMIVEKSLDTLITVVTARIMRLRFNMAFRVLRLHARKAKSWRQLLEQRRVELRSHKIALRAAYVMYCPSFVRAFLVMQSLMRTQGLTTAEKVAASKHAISYKLRSCIRRWVYWRLWTVAQRSTHFRCQPTSLSLNYSDNCKSETTTLLHNPNASDGLLTTTPNTTSMVLTALSWKKGPSSSTASSSSSFDPFLAPTYSASKTPTSYMNSGMNNTVLRQNDMEISGKHGNSSRVGGDNRRADKTYLALLHPTCRESLLSRSLIKWRVWSRRIRCYYSLSDMVSSQIKRDMNKNSKARLLAIAIKRTSSCIVLRKQLRLPRHKTDSDRIVNLESEAMNNSTCDEVTCIEQDLSLRFLNFGIGSYNAVIPTAVSYYGNYVARPFFDQLNTSMSSSFTSNLGHIESAHLLSSRESKLIYLNLSSNTIDMRTFYGPVNDEVRKKIHHIAQGLAYPRNLVHLMASSAMNGKKMKQQKQNRRIIQSGQAGGRAHEMRYDFPFKPRAPSMIRTADGGFICSAPMLFICLRRWIQVWLSKSTDRLLSRILCNKTRTRTLKLFFSDWKFAKKELVFYRRHLGGIAFHGLKNVMCYRQSQKRKLKCARMSNLSRSFRWFRDCISRSMDNRRRLFHGFVSAINGNSNKFTIIRRHLTMKDELDRQRIKNRGRRAATKPYNDTSLSASTYNKAGNDKLRIDAGSSELSGEGSDKLNHILEVATLMSVILGNFFSMKLFFGRLRCSSRRRRRIRELIKPTIADEKRHFFRWMQRLVILRNKYQSVRLRRTRVTVRRWIFITVALRTWKALKFTYLRRWGHFYRYRIINRVSTRSYLSKINEAWNYWVAEYHRVSVTQSELIAIKSKYLFLRYAWRSLRSTLISIKKFRHVAMKRGLRRLLAYFRTRHRVRRLAKKVFFMRMLRSFRERKDGRVISKLDAHHSMLRKSLHKWCRKVLEPLTKRNAYILKWLHDYEKLHCPRHVLDAASVWKRCDTIANKFFLAKKKAEKEQARRRHLMEEDYFEVESDEFDDTGDGCCSDDGDKKEEKRKSLPFFVCSNQTHIPDRSWRQQYLIQERLDKNLHREKKLMIQRSRLRWRSINSQARRQICATAITHFFSWSAITYIMYWRRRHGYYKSMRYRSDALRRIRLLKVYLKQLKQVSKMRANHRLQHRSIVLKKNFRIFQSKLWDLEVAKKVLHIARGFAIERAGRRALRQWVKRAKRLSRGKREVHAGEYYHNRRSKSICIISLKSLCFSFYQPDPFRIEISSSKARHSHRGNLKYHHHQLPANNTPVIAAEKTFMSKVGEVFSFSDVQHIHPFTPTPFKLTDSSQDNEQFAYDTIQIEDNNNDVYEDDFE